MRARGVNMLLARAGGHGGPQAVSFDVRSQIVLELASGYGAEFLLRLVWGPV